MISFLIDDVGEIYQNSYRQKITSYLQKYTVISCFPWLQALTVMDRRAHRSVKEKKKGQSQLELANQQVYIGKNFRKNLPLKKRKRFFKTPAAGVSLVKIVSLWESSSLYDVIGAMRYHILRLSARISIMPITMM